jgi:hypothetical protein
MRSLLLALPASLLLSGCISHAPDADCAANAMCAARAAEPAAIDAARGLALRQGDDLVLHPANTAAFTLTDRKAACDAADTVQCQGYALMQFHARAHALVVQRFLYEGSSFFLIDSATGRQTQLAGMPVFSPDGREFLVAPYDEENDAGPDNLEIWRRDGDGAVLEWAHTIAQEHADDPALPVPYQTRVEDWSHDRIRLTLFIDHPDRRQWSGTLTRTADGWRLDAQSPSGSFAAR